MNALDLLLKPVRRLVRLRRRRQGPMRPSWDESYETLAMVLHHYSRHSGALPLSWQRGIAHRFMGSARDIDGFTTERDAGAGVPGAWFRHPGASSGALLFYLHGGGYTLGTIATHRHLIERLALASGVDAFGIAYRLAPEHPHPAAVDDALCAYRYLLTRGQAPERLVVGGESAGGGLTMALLLALRDAGLPLPAAAFVISPWVDLALTGNTLDVNEPFDFVNRGILEQYASHFAAPHMRRDPLVSPLYASFDGLPPLLIHAGGAEVLLDDARRLAQRAEDAGVHTELDVWDDMIHAWHALAYALPQGVEAIERIGAFVRAQLDHDSMLP